MRVCLCFKRNYVGIFSLLLHFFSFLIWLPELKRFFAPFFHLNVLKRVDICCLSSCE